MFDPSVDPNKPLRTGPLRVPTGPTVPPCLASCTTRALESLDRSSEGAEAPEKAPEMAPQSPDFLKSAGCSSC